MSRLILPRRKIWTPPQRQQGYLVLDAYRGGGGGGSSGTAIKWNAADKGAAVILSAGDLTASSTTASWQSVRTVSGAMASGKWYDEVVLVSVGGYSCIFGVCTAGYSMGTYVGASVGGWAVQGIGSTGRARVFRQGGFTDYMIGASSGGRVKAAVDLDAGKGWFGIVGGSWLDGGDPAVGTSPTFTFTAGTTLYFGGSVYDGSGTITRVSSYLDAMPSGFGGMFA